MKIDKARLGSDPIYPLEIAILDQILAVNEITRERYRSFLRRQRSIDLAEEIKPKPDLFQPKTFLTFKLDELALYARLIGEVPVRAYVGSELKIINVTRKSLWVFRTKSILSERRNEKADLDLYRIFARAQMRHHRYKRENNSSYFPSLGQMFDRLGLDRYLREYLGGIVDYTIIINCHIPKGS